MGTGLSIQADNGGQLASERLTFLEAAFGLPADFLPPLTGLREPLLKSDLSGLSGLSKPLETVTFKSRKTFSFLAFGCLTFFAEAGMNSSVVVEMMSSSLMAAVVCSTFLTLLNSLSACWAKKSSAEINFFFGAASSSAASAASSSSASSSPSIWASASSPNLFVWDLWVSTLPDLECLSNFLSLPPFLLVDFGAATSLLLFSKVPFGLPPLALEASAFGGVEDFL